MKKNSKPAKGSWRQYLSLGIVLFIVIGIALLAKLSTDFKQRDLEIKAVEDLEVSSNKEVPALLFLDDIGVFIMDLSSTKKRQIYWPEDVSMLGLPLSQLHGVDTEAGQQIWLNSGFVKASSTVFRSPDGRRDASLASERRDGSGAIEIQHGNEKNVFVLRQRNGSKITHEQILGWLDKDSLAIVGVVTSTRIVFSLDLNGGLWPLSYLPDEAWQIKVFDGSVYFLTAIPGQGIELPQQPPTSIWIVAEDGSHKNVITEEDGVIENFIPQADLMYYSLSDNSLKVTYENKSKLIGTGRPLLGLDEKNIIIKDQDLLLITNDAGQRIELDQEIGKNIFYLPKVLLGQ